MMDCYGIYKGIVTNNVDPSDQSRIKAVVPQVFGDPSVETDWALPCIPPNYEGPLPLPGQGVWVSFEGGDTDYPLWLGVWQPS